MQFPLYFDSASTTPCCGEAIELFQKYARNDFGNPSSSHGLGQRSARAIQEARRFFGTVFGTPPDQVLFTGSGTESDNFAIYGRAMPALERYWQNFQKGRADLPPRVIASAIEHPAVKRTIESLIPYGLDAQWIPVDSQGQVLWENLEPLLTPQTFLVSIQQVNSVVGTIQPVEELARKVKEKAPQVVFHTDSVQAFGKIEVPRFPSAVDLVSLSGHKIEGPKGIGALIVLNKKLLTTPTFRPLVWGGGQENGFRSGTQNAGLIAGFHIAAQLALSNRESNYKRVGALKERLLSAFTTLGMLSSDPNRSLLRINSPDSASPYILNISVPGLPAAPLARVLEEQGCIVSVGSACHSRKQEPDPVLEALGLPVKLQTSAIRISLSKTVRDEEIQILARAIQESVERLRLLSVATRSKTR